MKLYFYHKNHGLLFFLVYILVGCGTPEHMRVTKGVTPKLADKEVVFRSTYYFRVFDYCIDKPGSIKTPRNEGLYRYRMTGKANALANHIRFESGTLKAYEIEPFGSNVTFDDNGARWVSAAEKQAGAQQESINNLFNELLVEREKYLDRNANSEALSEELLISYESKIDLLLNRRVDAALAASTLMTQSLTSLSGIAPDANQTLDTLFTAVKNIHDKKAEFFGDNNAFQKAKEEVEEKQVLFAKAQADFDLKLELLRLFQAKSQADEYLKELEADKPEDLTDQASIDQFNNVISTAINYKAWAGSQYTSKSTGFPIAEPETRQSQFNAARAVLDTAGQELETAKLGVTTKEKELRKLIESAGQSMGYDSANSCSPDSVKRGFQILGPEGWRTYDQDERLILAMHSKATPLISTMKELSGRVLNAKSPEANLLPLVQEQLKTSDILASLEATPLEEMDISEGSALKAIIDELSEVTP